MTFSFKKLWRWFLDLSQLLQFLITIGFSLTFLGAALMGFWYHVRGFLSCILTTSAIRWHTEAWATFVLIFLLAGLFFFQLGRVLILRKPQSTTKALSIVPDNEGAWEYNKGPIKASIKFNTGFWITNLYDRPASIVKCEMKKYNLRGTMDIINRKNDGLLGQEFQFQKNETVLLGVFFYPEKLKLRSQVSVKTNIIFIDNYGDEYVLKHCRFVHLQQQ